MFDCVLSVCFVFPAWLASSGPAVLSFTNCFSWQNYLQAQLKFRICSNCSLQGRHLRAKLYCSAAKASCLSPSWLRTSRVGLMWLVPLLCPAPCDPSFERSLADYRPWGPKQLDTTERLYILPDFFPLQVVTRYWVQLPHYTAAPCATWCTYSRACILTPNSWLTSPHTPVSSLVP